MTAQDAALTQTFDEALPELFARATLPEELAHGALKFVATQAPGSAGADSAWLLHAPLEGGPGARFVACSPSAPARCHVAMAADDYIALGRKALNLEMAFMEGRLKVHGDMGCAMQLGALFG